MNYLGINISKANARYVLLDNNGEQTTKGFTLTNDQKSFTQIIQRFKELKLTAETLLIGIEATGIWWENLYCFLTEQNLRLLFLIRVRPTNSARLCATRLKPTTLMRASSPDYYAQANMPPAASLKKTFKSRVKSSSFGINL